MTENRLQAPHGRRRDDAWRRAATIIGVILSSAMLMGMVGKTYLSIHQIDQNTSDISAVSARVTVLEQVKLDDHYMTCVMFERAVPDGVPASCALALSRGK